MMVEHRRQTTKEYKINLVSKTIKTTSFQMCLEFKMFLNRDQCNYHFVVSTIYVGKRGLDQLTYTRYVPRSNIKLESKWESVSLDLLPTVNETVMFSFQIVLPQGSQGFYAAIDDIVFSNERCPDNPSGK